MPNESLNFSRIADDCERIAALVAEGSMDWAEVSWRLAARGFLTIGRDGEANYLRFEIHGLGSYGITSATEDHLTLAGRAAHELANQAHLGGLGLRRWQIDAAQDNAREWVARKRIPADWDRYAVQSVMEALSAGIRYDGRSNDHDLLTELLGVAGCTGYVNANEQVAHDTPGDLVACPIHEP